MEGQPVTVHKIGMIKIQEDLTSSDDEAHSIDQITMILQAFMLSITIFTTSHSCELAVGVA